MRKGESKTSGIVPAGNFSEWLRATDASLRSEKGGSNVPCGACRGCCRSSMFIRIKPEETRTLQRIPSALLFPAPGLPKGNVLLGYNDKGHCPMLMDNECSIYEDRPQTCRDYDCRVFAATSISVDAHTQAEIANRVKAWAFDHESQASREEHKIVQQAAAFLEKNRDMFPPGAIPSYPVQLAGLAVMIYRLFSEMRGKPDAVIAQAILAAMNRKRAGSKKPALRY